MIENEFHVAISAEKSAVQPSTSRATISQPPSADSTLTAPKDENVCLESELPMKPPRHKQKANQPVETATIIDSIDDGDDVSFQEVCGSELTSIT